MAMEAATLAILDHHINVNSGGGKRVNNWYEKKGKTNKKLYKEMWAPKDHHSGASTNRRHFQANRSPPQRGGSRSDCDVELEEKLRMAKEEVRVLRVKIQLQHLESMEAMDFQELFFKEQIKSILEGRVDNYGGGKEEKKEEDAADCNFGTNSVLDPEPRPTKHLNEGVQRIMGEIEKMRNNKREESFEEGTVV
ncbi:unnamed protein product [Linum tenue]|uniref:Uncharacterized protein n=1 Tax=Linum tenue TaxID=586396 RepID=A0AAV0KHN7_9ROSI|nr:unnamed protein product [Linum tenue]